MQLVYLAAMVALSISQLVYRPLILPVALLTKAEFRTAPQTPHRAIDRVVTQLCFESNIELLIEHQRQHLTWSISKVRDYV